MRVSSAIVAVGLVLGLAACGSTNTAQTVSVATGPDSGTQAATTPVTSSVPSATSPGPATTAAGITTTPATVTTATITAPDSGGAGLTGSATGTATTASTGTACTAADLTAEAVPPNSAPGTTVLGFVLSNTSGTSCVSEAFPGVGLIDSAGTVHAVTTTRVTRDDLGATPVTRVTLGAGQTMSFRITLHDSGTGCGSYSGVQIIAPNDTATMKVTIPDGPVQACGDVTVSPVEAGATATGQ